MAAWLNVTTDLRIAMLLLGELLSQSSHASSLGLPAGTVRGPASLGSEPTIARFTPTCKLHLRAGLRVL